MSMATLYQIANDGSRAGRGEINDEPIVVGRSVQAKVSIEDEGVSRRHFLILRDGEAYVIKDLNSRNGTWLDGRRVITEKLHHDDRILAGNTLFQFAEPPVTSATMSLGPHGTVIVPAGPQPEHRPSETIVWQGEAGRHNLEAAA